MVARVSACTVPNSLRTDPERSPCYRDSVDILYLLDQLEEVLGGGSRLPLTSRTLVDEQEVLDILDQIRVSIPEELKAAKRLTQDRDQVLADAHAEANRILSDAEAQAAERVAEHSVARTAEQRAADIRDRALLQAEDIRHEADAYAYKVLQKLREQIGQVAQTVDRGLAELETRQPHEALVERAANRA
jgi:cell division septum initiation protein DivIVA